VTTGSIGPGTVLAGRYRLDDLLAESEGARFWRATDTILARSVAIHAVPSDDPRAPGLMEAARVSATVIDPHLLRVLDCDDEDGITWVVNEWGDGISLDLMLQQGTLPPSRAAWLTREVAEAIAAGHAQGVAHGRLNPESVLVTHAGAVKLIGYVVDASLQTVRPHDPLYGELDEREGDVIDLAGILYAALTGRWPGVAQSSVPRAPRESRRPMRPRQVRAGVPRALDAICDRVLNKEAARHATPIETAHEIAAALADYVGDPTMSAPIDAAGMHAEPTVLAPLPAAPQRPASSKAVTTSDSDPPDEAEADGDRTAVVPSLDPEATQVAEAVQATDLLEATETFQAPIEGRESFAPVPRPAVEGSPPPPFPDLPERPLYASTERRVPAAARAARANGAPPSWPADAGSGTGTGTSGSGSPGLHDTGADGTHGNGFWPFEQEPEDKTEVHTGKEGRGWLRVAIVIGVLLVLVVAMAVAFNRGRQDGTTPRASTDQETRATATKGSPVKLAGARDFDPLANPPEENPDTVAHTVDGDPATTWMTSTYRGDPELGGLKAGVGVMVDLGRDIEATSVTVRFKGAPTSFEVYAAPNGVTEPPGSLDELDKVGSRVDAPEQATVALDPAPTTRYLLVWLTKLPEVSGGYRGEIADITVRS
jgi:hypothetical protein